MNIKKLLAAALCISLCEIQLLPAMQYSTGHLAPPSMGIPGQVFPAQVKTETQENQNVGCRCNDKIRKYAEHERTAFLSLSQVRRERPTLRIFGIVVGIVSIVLPISRDALTQARGCQRP